MYAADPAADHARHRRLLVEDQRLRRFYTNGLMAIASGMDEEFSRPEGPASGWHIYVSGRKPGQIKTDLASPKPVCPDCGFGNLDLSLLHCQCRHCGRSYKTRYGIPYLLRDGNATYSPKPKLPIVNTIPADHRIDQVLRASYARLHERGARPALRLFGVDPATAFTVRHLRQNGVEVLGVVTTVERWIGLTVEGVAIQALREVARFPEPILLSGHPGMESSARELLHAVGFTGTVYYFGDGTLEEGLPPVRVDETDRSPRLPAGEPSTPVTNRFARGLVRKLLGSWR